MDAGQTLATVPSCRHNPTMAQQRTFHDLSSEFTTMVPVWTWGIPKTWNSPYKRRTHIVRLTQYGGAFVPRARCGSRPGTVSTAITKQVRPDITCLACLQALNADNGFVSEGAYVELQALQVRELSGVYKSLADNPVLADYLAAPSLTGLRVAADWMEEHAPESDLACLLRFIATDASWQDLPDQWRKRW